MAVARNENRHSELPKASRENPVRRDDPAAAFHGREHDRPVAPGPDLHDVEPASEGGGGTGASDAPRDEAVELLQH